MNFFLLKTIPLLLFTTNLSHSFSLNSPKHYHKSQNSKPYQKPNNKNNFHITSQLAAAHSGVDEPYKLKGEFGYNPYFEQYINHIREHQQSIASRGEISAYIYQKRFKQIEFLKSFFVDLGLEDNLIYRDMEQNNWDKQIFCLVMSYLASLEFYHQLVLSPLLNALKKSGYMDSDQLGEVQKTVSLFLDKYSAQESKKMLFKNSKELEDIFNKLILKLIENQDFMLTMGMSKEASSLVTFLTSIELPKEEEKVDHVYVLKKMKNVAEGLGLGAIEDLIYSTSEITEESVLSKMYHNAARIFENLDNNQKTQFIDHFIDWSKGLQKNSSQKTTSMSELWLGQIEKRLAFANFIKNAKRTNYDPNQLKTYDAGRRVIIIYQAKGVNWESYYGLKNLSHLTLNKQKIVTINNPKDLARSIMQYRNEEGYILIPDGDLASYCEELKDLKPAIEDAVLNGNWDIFGLGAGGVILADNIVEHLDNARMVRNGLGLIPGEGGEAFIPNRKSIKLRLPQKPKASMQIDNNGDYIKVSSESAGNTEEIASYSMDEDIGSCVLSNKQKGNIAYFSSLPIATFLNPTDDSEYDSEKSEETIRQSLAIWYDFLERTKAKADA